MGVRRTLPFIEQTLAVLCEHLGAELTTLILTDAERRLASWQSQPLLSRLPVAQCSGPGDPDDELWTMLWMALARRQPALFGRKLARMSPEPRGVSLAWLYVRRRHPEQLQESVADTPAGLVRCARVVHEVFPILAAFAGSDVLPETPTRFWRPTSNCVLHAYLQAHDWAAISLFCEPALRSHTFVRAADVADLTTEQPIDSTAFNLLLREHIRASLSQGALPGRPVKLGRLMAALDEAVVDVLSGCAAGLTFAPPLAFGLSRFNYAHQALALLSLIPDLSASDIRRIGTLGCSNLRAESDEAVGRLLSSFTGIDRSADEWLDHFTSYVPLEVRLTSPRLATHIRYENAGFVRRYDWADPEDAGERAIEEHCLEYPLRHHCETGPAIIWTTCCEYYRDGQLHRDNGPAVIDFDGSCHAYYRNDELHREDGPAVVLSVGRLFEIEVPTGSFCVAGPAELYFRDGELHRPIEEGPAVIAGTRGDRQEYWEHGKHLTLSGAVAPDPRR
jgi:hypothetical protein